MSETITDARASTDPPPAQQDKTVVSDKHDNTPAQAAQQARVGLLGDFLGSFENTFKSQANGAIQLANALGANIDEHKLAPVDKADFGTAEWGAQLAGQASALALEFFAARKLGAVVEAFAGKQSVATALGTVEPGATRMASSLGFGAVMGGVLTPTDNPNSFWSDRVKNAFASTLTMGTMTGAGMALEARSAAMAGGALQATLRNGFFNNGVGGLIGGTVGDMTRSALDGDLPRFDTSYWEHVGRNATEFALVGMGTHTLNLGAGKVHQFAAEHADVIADRMQGLAERTAMTLGLGGPALQPAYAMAGGARYFNSAAGKRTPWKVEWPQESSEQSTVLMKVKTGTSPGEMPAATKVSEVVRSGAAPVLDTKSTVSDRAREVLEDRRLKPFLDKIDDKFNRAPITEKQLSEIVERFPQKDQLLAAKFLEASVPNSSPAMFTDRVRAMNAELAKVPDKDTVFISQGTAGWGKAFGYLIKKLTNGGTIAPAEPQYARGETAVLLDDVNTTSYSHRELAGLQKAKNLYVMDLGGFEKGVNFFDYARGPETVSAKLQGLVNEAKQLQHIEPELTQDELINKVMNGRLAGIQKLNASAKIITAPSAVADAAPGPDLNTTLRRVYSGITTPWAPREKVADFISNFVPRNREPVAYMLAEGADPITYQYMVDLSRQLNNSILDHAESLGIPEQNILYHEANQGDSNSLVNYLHRLTNDIPASKFIEGHRIARLAAQGNLEDNAVVLLDDANYTHSKLDHRLRQLEGAEQAGAVMSGTLLGYSGSSFKRGADLGLRQFVGRRMREFDPKQWDGATEYQFQRARGYSFDSGFRVGMDNDPRTDWMGPQHSVASSLIFPANVPDNTIRLLRRFSRDVLGVGHIVDKQATPLASELDVATAKSTPHLPNRSSLLEKGTIKGVPKNLNYGDTSVVTVSNGQDSVKGILVPQFYDAGNRVPNQKAIAHVSRTLGLTPGYPAYAERVVKAGRNSMRVSLSQLPGTDDLIEHDKEHSRKDKLSATADLSDPELRLQTEKALLEHFIVAPGASTAMRFSRNADGSISVLNQRIFRPFSGTGKPLWEHESPVLSEEFARKQLSTGAIDALQKAYESAMKPAFKQSLRKFGLDDDENLNPLLERIEWLLEHRRFPDTSQSNP
jgi:hypothetical protein